MGFARFEAGARTGSRVDPSPLEAASCPQASSASVNVHTGRLVRLVVLDLLFLDGQSSRLTGGAAID